MTRAIASVTLVVHNYDEAIAFFTEVLRFLLIEDTPLENGMRWVIIVPAIHATNAASPSPNVG